MILRLLTPILIIVPFISFGQTTPVSTVYRPFDNTKPLECRAFAKYGDDFVFASRYEDSRGNVSLVDPISGPIWSNNYTVTGGPGWNNLVLDEILFTSDSNFLVSGTATEPNSSKRVASILKLTPSGDTLWTRAFDHSNSTDCLASRAFETLDSNYMLAWSDYEGTYLRKLDSQGNTLWSRSYSTLKSSLSSFKQAPDSSLYITSAAYNNNHILKLSSLGQFIWIKEYDQNYEIHDCEFTDSSILTLARSSSSQSGIIKMDASGATIWHQSYPYTWADYQGIPNRLEILSDSSIAFLSGADFGSILGITDSQGNMTSHWQLEMRSGDILERADKGLAIMGNGPIYGIKVQYQTHVGLIHTDSLFQGNCIYPYGTPASFSDTAVSTSPIYTESGSSSEIYLPIEIEVNGLTATSGCVDFLGELDENNLLAIKVYPTISESEFVFEWEQPGNIEFEIYDTQGRSVYECSADNYSLDIDLGAENSGLYFFTATHESGAQTSGKLIKQ